MINRKSLLCSAIALSLPGMASAAGFFLPEGASPGLGTAGAGDVVNTDSAAVIWSNPAAMAGLDGEMISGNLEVMSLTGEYKDNGSSLPDASKNLDNNPKSKTTMPAGGFFWHKPINDRTSFGLAITSFGGAALDYGSWIGQTLLIDNKLLSLQFNPALSYRINDQWSIGVGAQIEYATLEMNTSWAEFNTGNDWGYGYNLGVYFEPSEDLKLGLAYRSKVKHNFDDKLTVKQNLPATISGLNPFYETEISYAATASLGGSYQINDQWKVLASLGWQQWSDMKETPITIKTDAGSVATAIQRKWDDVWTYSIGAHYKLNNDWTLKGGFTYETPGLDKPEYQSPDLPSDRQKTYALGASTMLDNWMIDFFYTYKDLGNAHMRKGNDTLYIDGNFRVKMHMIGAGFTRKF